LDGLLIFMQIVLINLLLSGDNAVVIAMASAHLPPKQREKAIWWGAAAAVGLRCLLTVAAISLLQIPYLQAAGALLLLYIAIKLLADSGEEHGNSRIKKSATVGQAIWTIVVADFVMSLDNVLAIAAVADGDIALIILGLALSVPMIIWGSQVLGKLLKRFPWLSYLGAGLLAYAAGDMLMHDPGLQKLLHSGSSTLAEAVPLLCIGFSAYAAAVN
jgi:YjbE family integral membrane protein